MPHTPKRQEAGFTIIEVLIVLAIFGLIMMLILLAIPSLQRSGRNNQRKQDVATILQGVQRYMLNHSAAFPAGNAVSPDPAHTDEFFLSSNALTFYEYSPAVLHAQDPASAVNQGPVNDIDKLEIYNYAKCEQDGSGKSFTKGTDYRDVVALYAFEAGDSPQPKCQQM